MTRTGLSALAPVVTVLMATVWLAIGCGLSGTYGSSSAAQGTTVASAASNVASATVTAAPITGSPSTRPSPPMSPPASIRSTSSVSSGPPAGLLTSAGTVVKAHLGTFCWNGTCSDEFELPAKPSLPLLTVAGSDGQLSFELAPDVEFTKWSAMYSTRTMANLVPLAGGGSVYDPDSSATAPPPVGAVEFAPPPAGDWALVVSVHFRDASMPAARGDANYVWHIVVE